MPIRQGRLPTPEPSRHLQRLCYHFARKIRVDYDEAQGVAEFPAGVCRMRAEPGALCFECEAADADGLARLQHVIDAHVELFSRKAPLTVQWAPEERPAAGDPPR